MSAISAGKKSYRRGVRLRHNDIGTAFARGAAKDVMKTDFQHRRGRRVGRDMTTDAAAGVVRL